MRQHFDRRQQPLHRAVSKVGIRRYCPQLDRAPVGRNSARSVVVQFHARLYKPDRLLKVCLRSGQVIVNNTLSYLHGSEAARRGVRNPTKNHFNKCLLTTLERHFVVLHDIFLKRTSESRDTKGRHWNVGSRSIVPGRAINVGGKSRRFHSLERELVARKWINSPFPLPSRASETSFIPKPSSRRPTLQPRGIISTGFRKIIASTTRRLIGVYIRLVSVRGENSEPNSTRILTSSVKIVPRGKSSALLVATTIPPRSILSRKISADFTIRTLHNESAGGDCRLALPNQLQVAIDKPDSHCSCAL